MRIDGIIYMRDWKDKDKIKEKNNHEIQNQRVKETIVSAEKNIGYPVRWFVIEDFSENNPLHINELLKSSKTKGDVFFTVEAGIEFPRDFDDDVIVKLYEEQKYPKLGAVSCQILSDNFSIISSGLKTDGKFPPWRLTGAIGNTFDSVHESYEFPLDNRCIFLKREIVDKVGELDERCGIFWALEYSYRLAKSGFRVLYVPKVVINYNNDNWTETENTIYIRDFSETVRILDLNKEKEKSEIKTIKTEPIPFKEKEIVEEAEQNEVDEMKPEKEEKSVIKKKKKVAKKKNIEKKVRIRL